MSKYLREIVGNVSLKGLETRLWTTWRARTTDCGRGCGVHIIWQPGEVPLLTEETQPQQYIEVSQEPYVIYTQSLHEEPAASFMQPLGEPELILRVFRVHNLWHRGEDRSHWIFSVFIIGLTLQHRGVMWSLQMVLSGKCRITAHKNRQSSTKTHRKWNSSEELGLFLGNLLFGLFTFMIVYLSLCLFIYLMFNTKNYLLFKYLREMLSDKVGNFSMKGPETLWCSYHRVQN